MSRLRLQLQLCLEIITRLQVQLQLPYKIKNNRLHNRLGFKKKLSRDKFKRKIRHKWVMKKE
jgi:hypothetical protein